MSHLDVLHPELPGLHDAHGSVGELLLIGAAGIGLVQAPLVVTGLQGLGSEWACKSMT